MQTTEQYRSEASRLLAAECRLDDRALALLVDLGSAEQVAGGAVLDEEIGGKPAIASLSRLSVLSGELRGVQAAITEARRQRSAAIVASYRAEAADLRTQVAELRAEVAERHKHTAKLLDELRTFEEWPFAPSWANLGGVPVGAGSGVGPKTSLLAQRVADLDARATALESQSIRTAGAVEGPDVVSILAKIAAMPLDIAPQRAEVRTWAERVLAADKERNLGPRRQYQFVLVWRDSVIDELRSRVESAG